MRPALDRRPESFVRSSSRFGLQSRGQVSPGGVPSATLNHPIGMPHESDVSSSRLPGRRPESTCCSRWTTMLRSTISARCRSRFSRKFGRGLESGAGVRCPVRRTAASGNRWSPATSALATSGRTASAMPGRCTRPSSPLRRPRTSGASPRRDLGPHLLLRPVAGDRRAGRRVGDALAYKDTWSPRDFNVRAADKQELLREKFGSIDAFVAELGAQVPAGPVEAAKDFGVPYRIARTDVEKPEPVRSEYDPDSSGRRLNAHNGLQTTSRTT
jgi:hypothetical protein